MKKRKTPHCTGCHRPCRGHPGPLGKKCPFYLSARETAARERQLNLISRMSDVQTNPQGATADATSLPHSQAGTVDPGTNVAPNVNVSETVANTLNVVPISVPQVDPLVIPGVPGQLQAGTSVSGQQVQVTAAHQFVDSLLPRPDVPTSSVYANVSSAPPNHN